MHQLLSAHENRIGGGIVDKRRISPKKGKTEPYSTRYLTIHKDSITKQESQHTYNVREECNTWYGYMN
jgi:hypothetical protein